MPAFCFPAKALFPSWIIFLNTEECHNEISSGKIMYNDKHKSVKEYYKVVYN